MFRALEDAYSAAIAAKVPYTLPQLIDKALTKIQVVGQYSVAIDDWSQSEETVEWIKNWPNLRHHFTSHYNTKLASGGGTMQQHGYVNMQQTATSRTMTASTPFNNLLPTSISPTMRDFNQHKKASRSSPTKQEQCEQKSTHCRPSA